MTYPAQQAAQARAEGLARASAIQEAANRQFVSDLAALREAGSSLSTIASDLAMSRQALYELIRRYS